MLQTDEKVWGDWEARLTRQIWAGSAMAAAATHLTDCAKHDADLRELRATSEACTKLPMSADMLFAHVLLMLSV